MRVKVLSYVRNSIPYVKELRAIFGSPLGCILGQQLDYWSERYPKGFYKFMSPAPDRPDYREGDSWEEELGFSAKEFRTAFDFFGIRYKSASAFREVENPFVREDGSIASYCSVFNRRTGQTKYFRNHEYLDGELQKVLFTVNPHREVTETPSEHLQNCPSGTSINAHRADVYTETTPDPTSEPTSNTPLPPKGGRPDDWLFDEFWSIYPRQEAEEPALSAWKRIPKRDRQMIIDEVKDRSMRDASWIKQQGKFVPKAKRYLTEKQWKDNWVGKHSGLNNPSDPVTINVSAASVETVNNAVIPVNQQVSQVDEDLLSAIQAEEEKRAKEYWGNAEYTRNY